MEIVFLEEGMNTRTSQDAWKPAEAVCCRRAVQTPKWKHFLGLPSLVYLEGQSNLVKNMEATVSFRVYSIKPGAQVIQFTVALKKAKLQVPRPSKDSLPGPSNVFPFWVGGFGGLTRVHSGLRKGHVAGSR